MLFGWVLTDCLQELAASWEEQGKLLHMQDKVLTHLAWAGDL